MKLDATGAPEYLHGDDAAPEPRLAIPDAAEAVRRTRADAFEALASSTRREIEREHAELASCLLEASGALDRRDALIVRLRGLRDELELLGVPAVEPNLRLPPGAAVAAARLVPVLQAILKSTQRSTP